MSAGVIVGGIAASVLGGIISIIPDLAGLSGSSQDVVEREIMKLQEEINQQNKQWNDERQALFDIIGELGRRINELEHPPVPLWAMNKHYDVGDVVVFKDRKYQCIQAHDSYASNWTPLLAPALWQGI